MLQVLLPQLEALTADITVLSADTDAERRKREASFREVTDLKNRLQQVSNPSNQVLTAGDVLSNLLMSI